MDKYVQILKQNNLKVTPQRLEILRYLDRHRTHPTADEIYTKLKQTTPSLSKTTVYNSLEALIKHHIIQSLSISPTETRYDFKEDMHHHFLCTECGAIYDIDYQCPNIKEIRAEIEACGHHIGQVHGYFKGICKKCLKKEVTN